MTAEKNDRQDHWRSTYFGSEINFDREGKFRERKLINSWITHTFNPINMLNLFLAVISNSTYNNTNDLNDDDIISKYRKYLEENQMNTFKQNAFKPIPNSTDLQVRDTDFPTTLDLFFDRIKHPTHGSQNRQISLEYWKQKPHLNPFLIHSHYDQSILYKLDEETIAKLKEFLKKKYPSFYNRLELVDKFFIPMSPQCNRPRL